MFLDIYGLDEPMYALRTRICVPQSVYDDCNQMADNIPGLFSCINARDKFECMRLLDRDEADIVNLDAEEIYMAGRLYNLEPFVREEYNGNNYLQRTAVLVRRDVKIHSLIDLKNKRACLGPYNDLYRWNIPLGILSYYETMVPDCRSELQTVEKFFLEACAAGNWSTDLFLDEQLKRKHRRLCSLCRDNVYGLCSEQDSFAGPDGSIKCMTEGLGEIAFTTIEMAVDYFAQRTIMSSMYEFLCMDGTRMAITSRGCHWAKHPTNAFVIRSGRDRNKDIYFRTLQMVYNRFSKLRPSWFDKSFVSSLNVTQLIQLFPSNPNNGPMRYDHYLEFFIPSIEKQMQGCPKRNITFCLSKEGELSKCQKLQKAAFSRRIHPPIRCYQADSEETCIRLINERKADLMILSPDRFYYGARYQSLQALAKIESNDPQYSVAVVRSNSDLSMLSQMKHKRSCHSGFGHLASWTIPIGSLIRDELVEPTSCNRAQIIVDYFSASCVPGAADARINPNGTGVKQLCSQCIGDERGHHHCDLDFGERFSGEDGAIRCLVEGRGDVAFVSHDTILRLTNSRFPTNWAKDLKSSDFRLLCRIPKDLFDPRTGGTLRGNSIDDVNDFVNNNNNGGNGVGSIGVGRTLLHATIYDYNRCHIQAIPDSIIATSIFTPYDIRLDAMYILNQLSETFFGKYKTSFLIAGMFRNRSDIMFSDRAQKNSIISLEETLGDFLPYLESNDLITCGCISENLSFILIIFTTLLYYILLY
ncbi:Mfi2p [Dermatophagoides pteronyssinus]|uniref:Mfi2p n=1 Tax=Dermatophagoides pteronyssinus TaxID=6956 RepID=A0ABQ8IXI3_DERPT|nr:Mfi2p [Dermatophagoides pteronyssinus]